MGKLLLVLCITIFVSDPLSARMHVTCVLACHKCFSVIGIFSILSKKSTYYRTLIVLTVSSISSEATCILAVLV